MNNLTHLHIKKVKLYSIFILNKILLWTPHFDSMRFPLDGEIRF